jgi:hypothetical protein
MTETDAGLWVDFPRRGVVLASSACAVGLHDEVDLPTVPRDVSA